MQNPIVPPPLLDSLILLVFSTNWRTLNHAATFLSPTVHPLRAGRILESSKRSCEWGASKKERP